MGEDIIIVRRLLKNKILIEEYIVFSEELLSQYIKIGLLNVILIGRSFKSSRRNINTNRKGNYSHINLKPLVD
ncbi:hypothetical protein [Aquimarina longa]|uniref:hypothetical protein n=1 Tax=Aquimarina longa TaxID=1080221 RepID=UPI000AFAA56B